MPSTASFPLPQSLLILASALVLSGCGAGGTIPRDLMADEVRSADSGERPVAMQGNGDLIPGKLATVVTISRGFDRGGAGAAPRRGAEEEFGRRRERGFSDSISFGESEEEQKRAMEEYIHMAKARRAAGSPMPPVTLRVQFENRGAEPLLLEVIEVNSDLGPFAPRPTRLQIAPGEKGTLDPMVSQLGVTSDEMPVKIVTRVADKTEVHVVTVKNLIAPTLRK